MQHEYCFIFKQKKMGTDLANLIIANDIYKAVYSANQDHYSEFFRNKGIHSVTVSYRPFKIR